MFSSRSRYAATDKKPSSGRLLSFHMPIPSPLVEMHDHKNYPAARWCCGTLVSGTDQFGAPLLGLAVLAPRFLAQDFVAPELVAVALGATTAAIGVLRHGRVGRFPAFAAMQAGLGH